MRRRFIAVLFALTALAGLLPRAARAQAPEAPAPTAPEAPADESAAKKAEARTHFEKGLALYQQKQLEAALAEFLLSRKLYPTRSASFNATLVYAELGRHDEALELLEAIPKEFDTLSQADRDELQRQLKDVKGHVGYVVVNASEGGATVIIDGRERTLSSTRATPVTVGSHVVRVYKDGFLPFETRVDVAAQASVNVAARLGALTRAGRLSVTEDRGQPVGVLVDGVEVGKTPWEGTVPVGAHTVALRGEGRLGSPPTPVDVRLNQLTKISLVVEPLACTLRVEPTPRTASVAIDGVDVGHGVWEGPLRCGGHTVELGAEGFISKSLNLTLVEGPATIARDQLERDPTSAIYAAKNPPRITVEGSATMFLSPGFGGELTCDATCNPSPGVGGSLMARAGYRLSIGLGASIDAGYLTTAQSLNDRPTETRPYGLPPHAGRADDALKLSGPMLGASFSYTVGETFPFVARLGAGVLLGSFSDTRSGTFVTPSGVPYALPESPQTFTLTSLYIDPELRVGYRLFKGGVLELGVRGLVVASLGSAPHWSDSTELSLGQCPNPDRNVCSGRGVYAANDLASGTLLFLGPSIGFRGEL